MCVIVKTIIMSFTPDICWYINMVSRAFEKSTWYYTKYLFFPCPGAVDMWSYHKLPKPKYICITKCVLWYYKEGEKGNIHWLETSSKSLYLLTLFLNTCFVMNPLLLFDISSDFDLSLSSMPPLAMILFLEAGEGDCSGNLCFLIGQLSCNCKVPLLTFMLPWLMFFFLFFGSSWSLWFLPDEDEFDDFSTESSFWLRHQLQTRYDSAFGYWLLQYLCWDLNWQSLHLKSS